MIPEALQQDLAVTSVSSRIPDAILGASDDLGQMTLEILPKRIVETCRVLKHHAKYIQLSGVTCVDRLPREPRFDVVYLLHSVERKHRLRLKCAVGGETPEIHTVTGVWKGANWYEREVFDLFGVRFIYHPNPARILMPEYWQGHPLRKDYPVHGFKYSYSDET